MTLTGIYWDSNTRNIIKCLQCIMKEKSSVFRGKLNVPHNSAYFRNDNWSETIFFFFMFLHSNVPCNLENRSQKSLLAPLQLMFPSKFDQNTPISHSDRVKTILSYMLTLSFRQSEDNFKLHADFENRAKVTKM